MESLSPRSCFAKSVSMAAWSPDCLAEDVSRAFASTFVVVALALTAAYRQQGITIRHSDFRRGRGVAVSIPRFNTAGQLAFKR